jgi:anthranilate synthase component 1
MLIPSREEFLKTARPGDLVPVYREILADRLTPVSAYERIAGAGSSFLLESVEGGERLARYSFLGTDPFLTFKSRGAVATIKEGDETRTETLCEGRDALDVLKSLLSRYRFVETEGLPRFCGGAVGFLSYDMVRFFEELPDDTVDDLNVEDSYFLFTDSLFIFDHVKHRMKVLCNARVEDDAEEAYDRAANRIEALIERLRTPAAIPAPSKRSGELEVITNMTREDYEASVKRCKEYITAGDAFQVVPSQRFTVKLNATPFELYRALRSVNPSPYMYFLDLGEKQVVGSSPEILVTVEDGIVRLRPIAGTRPRGATPAEDRCLAEELLADEKEQAEHIMLVDLGRNDVGRVAEYGTVKVDELMVIERYSHVMHIVSNVTGKLAKDKDVFDAMRASFPAGTLTGAPKVRAMEIIEELEPTRRGLYGGAVGYFSFSGDMDFAIAIRTAFIQNGHAIFQAGGGVVADSIPANEYQESVNKSKALRMAIQMAEEGLE